MADRMEHTTGSEAGFESGDRGATDKVKDGAHKAQEKASEMASKAKHKTEDLAHEGREKAEEMAHKAGDMARSRASEEKSRVATGIRTVADALRRGSEDLPEDRRSYGRFVESVADRAEDLSRYLENRDVDDLAREARRFARDHTGVVLSGAFALGLLGARFLKSSSDEARAERWTSQGYAGERTYEAGYRTSGGYPQTGGSGRAGGYSRGEVYHAGRRDEPLDRERTELGGAGLTGTGGGMSAGRSGLGGTDTGMTTGGTGTTSAGRAGMGSLEEPGSTGLGGSTESRPKVDRDDRLDRPGGTDV